MEPHRGERSLDGAVETARVRRQVVDVEPPPPPKVAEYHLVSRRCGGCGHVNDPAATDVPRPVDPGSDVARPAADARHEADAPEPATEPATESMTEPVTEPVTEPGPASPGTGVAPDPVVALALRPGSPVGDRPADHRAGGVADLRALPSDRAGRQCAGSSGRDRRVHRVPGGCPRTCRARAGSRVPAAPASPVTHRRGITRRRDHRTRRRGIGLRARGVHRVPDVALLH